MGYYTRKGRSQVIFGQPITRAEDRKTLKQKLQLNHLMKGNCHDRN